MKRKAIIIITSLVLSVSLAACSNQTTNTGKTDDNIQTEQIQTDRTPVLTDYVTGLKDWTVEVNAKNVNFLDGVTYDEEVVKEVTADDSKVDLTKEGKYDLVYSIIPLDDSVSNEAVTKTVTVNVVSVEKAQEEADSGKQVVTDGGEIKKDSNGNTPKPPKEETTVKPTDKPSQPDNKPSNPNNKPTEPSKPNNDNNNQGNDNNQGNKPHTHSWKDVSSTAGDCSHKGKVTQKCDCGETRTVDGNFGDHNWKDHYETIHHDAVYEEKPVWDYCYECKKCHAQFKDENECGDHCLYDCDSRYTFKKWIDHYDKVLVKDAWTETVKDGKDCTICGKHTK